MIEENTFIYANTIVNGKYYKIKTKVVEVFEITKEEYFNTKEKCDNYNSGVEK